MKANKIGHVHLNVRNLENAERFYTEVFGFRVTERIRDTFVFLSLGDHHHDLALRNVGANAPIPPDLSVGMYHFAIEVENRKILAEVCKKLQEMGVSMGSSDHGISHALYFRDPEGNEVEAYVDMRNRNDEQTNGAPKPLDLNELLSHLDS
ncbi:MAG TPA: biphenyl-2,3-diol 1,2-dioxygenase [Nitrospinae bacterium]|nr:biphenyl-2,3-diol 1,2-dioxygenase [Nitrospinota bacterium]